MSYYEQLSEVERAECEEALKVRYTEERCADLSAEYGEAYVQGVKESYRENYAQGRIEAHARCMAIITSDAGMLRPQQALVYACKSDMPEDVAIQVLSMLPVEENCNLSSEGVSANQRLQ